MSVDKVLENWSRWTSNCWTCLRNVSTSSSEPVIWRLSWSRSSFIRSYSTMKPFNARTLSMPDSSRRRLASSAESDGTANRFRPNRWAACRLIVRSGSDRDTWFARFLLTITGISHKVALRKTNKITDDLRSSGPHPSATRMTEPSELPSGGRTKPALAMVVCVTALGGLFLGDLTNQ